MQLEIIGEIPSKANKYRMGKGSFYVDSSVKKYQDNAIKQLRAVCNWTYDCDVAVNYLFVLKRNKDIDNLLKTVNDCLQRSGILQNDKQIVEGSFKKIIAKDEEEKVVITIEEVKCQ